MIAPPSKEYERALAEVLEDSPDSHLAMLKAHYIAKEDAPNAVDNFQFDREIRFR